jgi:hypothetical protein
MMEPDSAPLEIDTSKPHPARMYNYYLGGTDNYAVDGKRQELYCEGYLRPWISHEYRKFLQRAVRCLVGEAGIKQIIDIGTGIPAAGNVHEVVQQIDPSVRVVYVDNDPVVQVHASALLSGQGRTSMVLPTCAIRKLFSTTRTSGS